MSRRTAERALVAAAGASKRERMQLTQVALLSAERQAGRQAGRQPTSLPPSFVGESALAGIPHSSSGAIGCFLLSSIFSF